MAAAADAGDATVIDLRTMLNGLSDSVTALTGQMALLMEDPTLYWARYGNLNPEAQLTERGPAVRGAEYAHKLQEERYRFQSILERIDTLESNVAFCSSELTEDRGNVTKLEDALNVVRNDLASSRASVNGVREEKKVVTGIRGFDKLKTYKGAAVEWKEWRFKLVTWLSQASPPLRDALGQARLQRVGTHRTRDRRFPYGRDLRAHQ